MPRYYIKFHFQTFQMYFVILKNSANNVKESGQRKKLGKKLKERKIIIIREWRGRFKIYNAYKIRDG